MNNTASNTPPMFQSLASLAPSLGPAAATHCKPCLRPQQTHLARSSQSATCHLCQQAGRPRSSPAGLARHSPILFGRSAIRMRPALLEPLTFHFRCPGAERRCPAWSSSAANAITNSSLNYACQSRVVKQITRPCAGQAFVRLEFFGIYIAHPTQHPSASVQTFRAPTIVGYA